MCIGNVKRNEVAAVKLAVIILGAFLVCAALAIPTALPEEQQQQVEKGVRADAQTLRARLGNNETFYPGVRLHYTNATGVKGYIVYWTTRAHFAPAPPYMVIYRGSDGGSYGESAYSYSAAGRLTALTYIMDNAYADASPTGGWLYNSQSTFILENATGFIAWTYTKKGGESSPWDMDRTNLTRIPVPTAAVVGSNIEVTWPHIFMATPPGGDTDPNTVIEDINAQRVGYTVWRSTTNATWNDNISLGPVVGNPNDWVLVSGVEPISGTNWTDTLVEIGKTYYYSIKVVFNGSWHVGTIWGGQGSAPILLQDTTPPQINHTPITSAYTNRSIALNATITDLSGVKNVTLWYRGVNRTEYYNISMWAVSNNNTYSAAIPVQKLPGIVYYRIYAIDNYNNSNETEIYEVAITHGTGNIAGKVTDNNFDDPQPLAGALINVLNTTYNTTTNSTGDYVLTGVPEGRYTIRASKDYYERCERTENVTAGETKINVDFALAPANISLAPYIVYVSPENVVITTAIPTIYANYTAGYNISSVILKIGAQVVAPYITNRTITYKPQAPLPDGEYQINIEIRDEVGFVGIRNWSFTVITKGTVRGTVRDIAMKPLSGVNITVVGLNLNTITDLDGTYEFVGIATGEYYIYAYKSGYTDMQIAYVRVYALRVSYANFTLDIVLRSCIRGIVLDLYNNPISNATVSIANYSAITSAAGYYSIPNLLPGNYILTASKSGYASNLTAVSISLNESMEINFVLRKLSEELPEPGKKNAVHKPAFIPSTYIPEIIYILLLTAGVLSAYRKRKIAKN